MLRRIVSAVSLPLLFPHLLRISIDTQTGFFFYGIVLRL